MPDKTATLTEAVAQHVRAGDVLHPIVGHTRWTAATREVVRQWWGRDPQFTLAMLSLSSLGALFFRGGLVKKVITGYSGDTFPNFTPNPWFAGAYERGEVEVEHWSFLAFSQRLEAAARGLPAIVTRSIAGSSMEENDGFARAETPFGEVGLLAPLVPDVALMHGLVADREGNVVVHPPLLEGVWGALAARRGVIVTVEKIVDDVRPWSHLVRIPAHLVLAVVECPMGAHPGGLYAGAVPVDGYGEDYDFWVDARAAHPRRRGGVRRVDPALGPRGRVAGAVDRPARRAARRRVASESRSRVVARRRDGVPARSRRAGERVGTCRGLGCASPRGAGRRDRRPRGARGCGSREPRGLARRATRAGAGLRREAHGRDRSVGLRRDAR